MTPWLDLAEAEIGTKEGAGSRDNPVVMAYYADAGHPEIDHDEVAWCAAFVGAMLKRAGYPNTGSLAARSYTTYGRKLTKPELGCIVVMTRGKNTWEGHVGFYIGDAGSNIRILGGNQGDAVSIASAPKSRVIAYRMPIAPTVKALRDAGSTEVKAADTVQVAAGGAAVVGGAAEAARQLAPDPQTISTDLTTLQQIGETINAVGELVGQHWYVALAVLVAAAWIGGSWWKRHRLARHSNGLPLSGEIGNA